MNEAYREIRATEGKNSNPATSEAPWRAAQSVPSPANCGLTTCIRPLPTRCAMD